MLRTPFFLVLAFLLCMPGDIFSAECSNTPVKKLNIDRYSTRSLFSPNHKWKFLSVAAHSPYKTAMLYIQNTESSEKWSIGWTERRAMTFWSEDSQRLLLRDDYAADDTKIRVFDVTREVPKEIKGLDDTIRRVVLAHTPQDKTIQWLYYPEVCFAVNDSSTIVLVADAPLVPRKESGSGRPFRLKLTANIITGRVIGATPNLR